MNPILAVALKDLSLEGRSREVLSGAAFFAVLVLMILGFALGPDSQRLRDAGPGVLWVAIAFASVLAAGRAWTGEQESEALEGLLLYPVSLEGVYLGKLLANFVLMLGLCVITVPLAFLLYGLPIPLERAPLFLLFLILGVLGFCVISTFYGALTVSLRAREALLPVLMFPILIPVVLGSVKGTALLGSSGPLPSEITTWLGLLAAFDLIYLVVASLAFPAAVEG